MAKDIYTSSTITIDVADGSPQYWIFNNMSKYSNIAVQISWYSLSAADGNIKFQESIDGAVFNDVAALDTNMDVVTDSVTLQHTTLNARAIKILFDMGTAVTGVITIDAIASTED